MNKCQKLSCLQGFAVSSILAVICDFDDASCWQTFTVHKPCINIQTLCEYTFLTYLIYLKQVFNGGKNWSGVSKWLACWTCNQRITGQA